MDTERFVSAVLDIGERMLVSGAEISRVEDTMTRICRAYKAQRAEAFTITSVIILTAGFEGEKSCTLMRRVGAYKTDLEYLNGLNDFSRRVCRDTPPVEELCDGIMKIGEKPYPAFVKFITYSIIAASFSLYSGGSPKDALVSAFIGVLLAGLTGFFEKLSINKIFSVFCSSLFCGAAAAVFVSFGAGDSVDNIIIGNIMSLVPGLALTNSVRDMINGDVVSGLMRLSESIFIAVAIAAGFAMSTAFL